MPTLHLPNYVQEVIERIAFAAREDKKIDKRCGVSQRLPISAMENVISNAERRAIRNDEKLVVPRISDVYAALPAITGKLELEYEGEMKGADFVGRELIRAAIAKTYDEYFTGANVQQIVQWFDLGGEIQLADSIAAAEALEKLKGIQGLIEKSGRLASRRRTARSSRFRPPNSFSKACMPTSASAATKNEYSRPEKKSPSPCAKKALTRKNRRTGREGSLIKISGQCPVAVS